MLWQDLRQALRTLPKSPGFSLAVLLTLALGIGATTALFSVTNGVLLKPLPYPDAGRLAVVYNTFAKEDLDRTDVSYPDFADWRRSARSFTELAAVANWPSVTLRGTEDTERIRVSFVSSSYWKILGVEPLLGRAFLPEEDQTAGGHPVVMLSHALWQRRFAGDTKVVGTTLQLNGQPFNVVGVMPESFHDLSREVEMWLPMQMVEMANPGALQNRAGRAMVALARLRPGVSLEAAQKEMETLAGRLEKEYRDTNEGYGARVFPLTDYIYDFRNTRRSVIVLLAASAFVLLIGCVNIGSLLLARGTTRRKEIGLRLAMGASRRQLTRQLLAESFVFSVLGGILGLILAFWGTRTLLALGNVHLPTYVKIGLDARVLAVALFLSIVTGLLCGLWPALKASRQELRESLQGSGKQQGGGDRGRGRNLLVVAEVALAVILLVGAGLMIKSFLVLHRMSLGFDTERLLTMRIDLPNPKYAEPPTKINLANQLAAEVKALPGVRQAGVWGPGIPGNSDWYMEVYPEERRTADQKEALRIFRHHVTPGALKTLGMPILKGRDLSPADTPDTPFVAVVSESFAAALWPGQDPIGKRFVGSEATPTPQPVTVVGLVKDVRHRGRTTPIQIPRDFYASYLQYPVRFVAVYLKSTSDPAALTTSLRRIVAKIDPDLAGYDIVTADRRAIDEESDLRFTATLMAIYAVMALLLASLGIYSVLAYAVSRRTGEIGLRMALGAGRGTVYGEVIRSAMVPVAAGLALGLAGAFALTRVMAKLVFEVSPADPFTFVIVPPVLALVALLACSLPALRAMRVDPILALRYE